MTAAVDLLSQQLRISDRENSELKIQIEELKKVLAPEINTHFALGLTRSEEIVLSVLLSRPLVTRDMAMAALYFNKLDEPDTKIIDVWVCKLRTKLSDFGATIENHRNKGWNLTPKSKKIISDMTIQDVSGGFNDMRRS